MGWLVSYMFTSLDGYIADRHEQLDWVPVDDELMRFANAFFATAGGIVFGRNVYQGFVDYWDRLDLNDPSVSPLEVEFAATFRGLKRVVVSTTLQSVQGNAQLIGEDVPRTIGALKRRSADDLLLIYGPRLRSTLV